MKSKIIFFFDFFFTFSYLFKTQGVKINQKNNLRIHNCQSSTAKLKFQAPDKFPKGEPFIH